VAETAKTPVIAINEVCFNYGETKVLDKLSMVVEEGDFMGLLGPNGGGKTTLVKLIIGLLKPACGEILLFGTPQQAFRDWHLIGYVPQTATNFDRRFPISVEEVVSMGAAGWDRRAIHAALAQVGIEDLAKRRIGELSGGQQQRAFIARALVARPKLLILDEPTAGVDIESNERFWGLLRDLNRSGITILLVSHDVGTITQNANRVACIAGSLFYHCPAQELTDERLHQLFAGQQILHHHHTHKDVD
jgi:zinc transport system ATP-binding protein